VLEKEESMLAALVLGWATLSAVATDDPDFDAGVAAVDAGDYAKAVRLLTTVIAQKPKHYQAHVYRGIAYEKQEKYTEAVGDYSKCVDLMPKVAEVWNVRGAVYFKLAKFDQSLADFDKYLELRPAEKNGHWMRGITCYYAGKFDEGKKQFEGYEKVDTNDVENAVWHFLCVARKDGVDKARAGLLKIGKDRRVPMSQVYELFAGKLKPDDVLQAAKTPGADEELLNRQLFYAHLYLGLYFEVSGDAKKSLEHLEEAVRHRISHYMWDVARVHREYKAKKSGAEK
jgi:lipoprotein NlpI